MIYAPLFVLQVQIGRAWAFLDWIISLAQYASYEEAAA
jgi:hypothetical protein